MKDTKPPAFRGHTTPPPGLGGSALAKWIEENSSALGISRDAEFSAKQKKAIEAIQASRPLPTVASNPMPVAAFEAPEKPSIPITDKPPDPAPMGGNQFDGIPLKTPGEWESVHFDNENPFRQIEGRRPKDEAELAGKIKEVFQLPYPDVEEYKFSFQATRMVKGFFLYEQEKAFDFRERLLSCCLTFDELLGYWDQVKLPCWLVEGFIQQVPTSWYHPSLHHPSGIKSNTRQLAGVAYRLQAFWGDEWFRMYQEEIAQLIDVSQQQVSNSLNYLCKNGWLETRPVKSARCKEYRCPVCLEDAAKDQE
jgi:hypothetical protein